MRYSTLFSVFCCLAFLSRLTKKKRVLQEVHEADINVERNRLESVGKAYSEDAKNKEQIFLQEKVTKYSDCQTFSKVLLAVYIDERR